MSLVAERPKALEAGDHLTPEEFDALYTEDYEGKVELIDGVVFVPSPPRFEFHGEPAAWLSTLAGIYAAGTPGVRAGSDASIRFADGGRVQPDILLLRDRPGMLADGYIIEAPAMAIEVAASSASYDLYEKKELYRRNGVPEYLVWRVLDHAFSFFRLEGGEYASVEPDGDGLLASTALPGFVVDTRALLAGDLLAALARLREAMASA